MVFQKSKLAVISKDTLAISDDNEEPKDFDPDKTVYDLKTKNIKNGQLVILIKSCSESLTTLILVENELFWVTSDSLQLV